MLWLHARLSSSIILQQPLDVIEFDLGPLRVTQPPAKLFENPAHPLYIDLTGNLHRQIVAEILPMHRASQGIALGAVARLTAGAGTAGAVALAVAVLLLHGLGEALRSLAQGIQCLALRIDGAIGVALAELAAGIAHGAIGRAEAILVIALAVAVLTWLLALLTLLTALARSHAALGQFFLQLLQPVAQTLLILLQIAHALIALLLVAALAVAPRILALLERFVAQLLLLADHVAEFVQRLLHVIAGLAGLGELQALQHL